MFFLKKKKCFIVSNVMCNVLLYIFTFEVWTYYIAFIMIVFLATFINLWKWKKKDIFFSPPKNIFIIWNYCSKWVCDSKHVFTFIAMVDEIMTGFISFCFHTLFLRRLHRVRDCIGNCIRIEYFGEDLPTSKYWVIFFSCAYTSLYFLIET